MQCTGSNATCAVDMSLQYRSRQLLVQSWTALAHKAHTRHGFGSCDWRVVPVATRYQCYTGASPQQRGSVRTYSSIVHPVARRPSYRWRTRLRTSAANIGL